MKKVLSIRLLLAVTLTGVIYLYTQDYYRADETVAGVVATIESDTDNILVFDSDNREYGLIFYPGGKVEYTAYAPLMQKLAANGIMCVLVEMPLNLAVLDVNAADGIQEKYPEIKEWYIGGHSLGGSMAASYIAENCQDYSGLVMLAAYSTEDLSETDIKVLSIYGTEDNVLNMEKYIDCLLNLPRKTNEIVIPGGCHAYFGNYGEQEGDGIPEISRRQQQDITVKEITDFIK